MTEAVIVSTARTGIGKAYRGALNNTHGATLGGHVIAEAVRRARLEPGEVEDVVMGCALPEGATGHNIARQAAMQSRQPWLPHVDDVTAFAAAVASLSGISPRTCRARCGRTTR